MSDACITLISWREYLNINKHAHLELPETNVVQRVNAYYRQFFTNIKMKNHNINTSLVNPGLCTLEVNKTGFDLIFFYSNIRGKLSMI